MNAVLRFWATGFGSGFFPFASGTAGTLVAVAIYCWVPLLPLGSDGRLGWETVATLVVLTATGILASQRAEREFGEDGSPIVVDEMVGLWITVAGLVPTPSVVIGGFLLFRFFDIFKPFPARQLESLHGGTGVMLDDVVAGIYGAITLRLILHFVPGLYI
ncbi:MAG: phosphatidylglycerophosphatase A [Gemmatimonadetes bacterium]|nr:phosphatidylglycerophosphatase A [Gemmatimonadota bacterium]